MIDLNQYLRLMVNKEASDLFFSTNAAPQIKINGVMRAIGETRLPRGETEELAASLLSEKDLIKFKEELEANFAYEVEGLGRFRVNIMYQRGDVALVFRYIRQTIPSVEDLGLPPVLERMVMEKSGLVLIVGATGSGKSTTLASMIDYRNTNSTGHILTIEDPIEFSHPHKRSMVNQREVGIDTHSYGAALMNAMREAPDVIMIGEIRDRATMEEAIRYSETGHLCLATLHSTSAPQAVQHVCNFFDDSEMKKVNMDLSVNLRAVVAMRLVRNLDQEFIPATEILINTPYVSDVIATGDHKALRDAMEKSTDKSAHSFDMCLLRLFKEGKISKETALANAYSRNNLNLQINLGGEDSSSPTFIN